MIVVNKTEYPTDEFKAAIRYVLSRYKRTFRITKPLERVTLQPYRSGRWTCQYDGDGGIVMKIGTRIRFPKVWLDQTLPTWQDLVVAMFAWCLILHYQKVIGRKYSGKDATEVAARTVQKWRVNANMDLIQEKLNGN